MAKICKKGFTGLSIWLIYFGIYCWCFPLTCIPNLFEALCQNARSFINEDSGELTPHLHHLPSSLLVQVWFYSFTCNFLKISFSRSLLSVELLDSDCGQRDQVHHLRRTYCRKLRTHLPFRGFLFTSFSSIFVFNCVNNVKNSPNRIYAPMRIFVIFSLNVFSQYIHSSVRFLSYYKRAWFNCFIMKFNNSYLNYIILSIKMFSSYCENELSSEMDRHPVCPGTFDKFLK